MRFLALFILEVVGILVAYWIISDTIRLYRFKRTSHQLFENFKDKVDTMVDESAYIHKTVSDPTKKHTKVKVRKQS